MKRRIILCGIKHCGKSAAGKALARLLHCEFADTDELLAQKGGMPVRELFRTLGEKEFRKMEQQILEGLMTLPPCVIALGGGALEDPANREIVRKAGTLVWCDVDDRTAFDRIAAEGLPPFLAGFADPFSEFQRRNVVRRQQFQQAAELRFQPDEKRSPEENASLLAALLQKTAGLEL